jgi:peptidoglycan/LPS O-acetylase OafA/YrhL
MERTSDRHIDSLDGLRGIAILLVFCYHYLPNNDHNPFSWMASLGWTGVDLFFVLSGFLITGILYDTRKATNFFKVFYARRALRLFPLYFFAVAIVLVVGVLSHSPIGWKAIPFYIYGANLMLPLKNGSPNFTPYFSCYHFWSLALEEQFYSVWPLVVYFVARRKTLIHICIGGMLSALVFRVVLTHFAASPQILYTELPSRMDSLLVGALLALTLREPGPHRWRTRAKLYSVIGVCCLILAILLVRAKTLNFTSPGMTSWGYSLLAAVFGCVLALALIPGTVANRVGRLSVLRFFGRYSYGLYVWHALLSPIGTRRTSWFTNHIHPLVVGQMAYTLVLLAIFTAIAYVSFHLLENPFLRLKSRFRNAYPQEESAKRPGASLHTADKVVLG